MAYFLARRNVIFPGQDGLAIGEEVDVSGFSASRVREMVASGVLDEEAGGGPWPRYDDGGWYSLSDGSRVQGKNKAHDAQAALDGGDDSAEEEE